jgi:hypothetical protein
MDQESSSDIENSGDEEEAINNKIKETENKLKA